MKKIWCLLWTDDVLLISSEPKEPQLMLEITNARAGKYHIEFGEEKSNVMKIGQSKNNPKFTLEDMNLNSRTNKKPGVYTEQQKQPWRPHQGPKRESRKRLPNPTSHSREQELRQHMGTNTKLHCINHSIQQRNLVSRENRTGTNQKDYGQHNKKNTNGITRESKFIEKGNSVRMCNSWCLPHLVGSVEWG